MKGNRLVVGCLFALLMHGCGRFGSSLIDGALLDSTNDVSHRAADLDVLGNLDVQQDSAASDAPFTDEYGTSDSNDLLDLSLADANPGPFPSLPLRTQGRFVVDEAGRRVRLIGVNWNGAHEEPFVPTGLDFHPPAVIANRLAELGFNSVRLTWSNEMVETNPIPAPASVAGWPEASGMNAMEVFDRVVAALTDAGILVILNNHMSDAGFCCNDEDGNGLWYNQRYSEEAWIADWIALAHRYSDNPLVVAADLRNEPRQGAKWASGTEAALDWPSAAERCAEEVLAVRPDWLIVVEGVGYASNLTGAKKRPIELSVPNRLVYSVHDYPWFSPNLMPDAQKYAMIVDDLWGFMLKAPYDTPVWIGEFGTCNTCWGDPWVGKFTQYVRDNEMDWSLWLIFGSAEGWGLLSAETLEFTTPDLPPLLQAWGLVPPEK